jgi:hypothetical protein
MRLPHVSVRLVAVLMLLAGGSLGVFAARTLWAGREEPVAPQHLNPAIDAKVRLYVSYYGLDAQKAEQIRLLLTEFDQRTLQLYRRLRAENPVEFEVLRDEIDAQIRDIIAPAGAAPAPRSR